MIGSLIGGVLGAVAGAAGSNSSQTTSVNLAPASDLENNASGNILDLFKQLQSRMTSNPAEADQNALYSNQNQATDQYANLLQALSQNGGVPTQAQTNSANQYAQQAFSAEQTGLNQAFGDQKIQMERMAAQMGRSIGDPILRAKLAQEQIRQQAGLNSRQNSFAAQYAQGIGQNQLQGAEALMGLRSGLANQAIQNRMTLLNLGSQLQANERNFRLQTASRTQNGSSGGGLSGAISGGMAGFGTFSSPAVQKGFEGLGNMFSNSGGAPKSMGINDASGGFKFGGYV